jgi:hypothetical protein
VQGCKTDTNQFQVLKFPKNRIPQQPTANSQQLITDNDKKAHIATGLAM